MNVFDLDGNSLKSDSISREKEQTSHVRLRTLFAD